MAIIVVNTASDIVASDGKTSLREAIATASTMSGHVEIRFDEKTFFNTSTSAVTAINLTSTLTITKGDIAIDGSLFFGGTSYNLKITADSSFKGTLIKVGSQATVNLEDVKLSGNGALAGGSGAAGPDGQNGTAGSGYHHPNFVSFEDGSTGTAGTDATDGSPGGDGGAMVGAISNDGNLTLERVKISDFTVNGGAGGLGGSGGHGGKGGDGGNGPDNDTPGGGGGDGGDSGSGANGGAGGGAVAGILNKGTLTLRDTSFVGVTATGGNGGGGGYGEHGGAGGQWGQSFDNVQPAAWPFGGDGGDGGNGGNGGVGGYAATGVLNLGKVVWQSVQSDIFGQATGGIGGAKGYRGDGGIGGSLWAYSGTGDTSVHDAHNGKDGTTGIDGTNGATGQAGNFIGATPVIGASFVLDAPRTVVSEKGDVHGRTVYFALSMLGGTGSANSVKVTYTPGPGVSASDFLNGNDPAKSFGTPTTPSNSKTFTVSANSTQYFGFIIAPDSKAEGIETFTFTLSTPQGGVLGYSKSVTVAIIDGTDIDGNAPTAIKLSTSTVVEDAANGKVVGSLSSTDVDTGDQFHYSLLNSAGGRFALSGNKVVVAKGFALDYEQAHSQSIVVRSTDLFGNTIDKTLTIAVTNLDPENVLGDSGANKIVGGSKADVLNGGAGNDSLVGGGGADKFVFSTTLNPTTNVDHISGFVSGTDKIQLSHAMFSALPVGALNKAAFWAAASSHDSSDRILYDKGTGKLYYDADGNKSPGGVAPVLFAVLDGHPALAYTDIQVI